MREFLYGAFLQGFTLMWMHHWDTKRLEGFVVDNWINYFSYESAALKLYYWDPFLGHAPECKAHKAFWGTTWPTKWGAHRLHSETARCSGAQCAPECLVASRLCWPQNPQFWTNFIYYVSGCIPSYIKILHHVSRTLYRKHFLLLQNYYITILGGILRQ